MKKKILGTVLLSAVVFSNVGGSTVSLAAIKDQADSKGSVTVKEGGFVPPKPDPTDPENKPSNPGDSKDPENPGGGVVVPDIPGPHNPDYPDKDPGNGFTPGGNPGGALAILGASNLKFPEISTSGNNVRKAAQAARVWVPSKYNDDGTIAADATYTAKPVGNYVQFGDVRTEESGYLVNVTFDKQFTSTEGELTGAWLQYTNGVLTHADGTSADVDDFKLSTVLNAGDTENVVEVTSDTANKKGKGLYSVEYGQTDQLKPASVVAGNVTSGTEANSVFLNVPSSTAQNMKKGNYIANIIWSIEEEAATPTKPTPLP